VENALNTYLDSYTEKNGKVLIRMAHFQTKHHNYNDDEIISALQKCIRRGMEKEAMYFALELGNEGKSGFGLLHSRLHVITYEDIGLADSTIVNTVSTALSDMKMMYKQKKGDWEMVLSYIILSLCRAQKSRITDHFKIMMKQQWNDTEKHYEIPDFALDMHTSQGNLLGRSKGSKQGINHFIKQGEKLENENPEINDIYQKQVQELWKKKKK
jgi:replication-associated recombination protein RarA